MSEPRFMIKEASKQLDVEPHVLRYWEEELEMDIPRNEMGHRYYLEQNLKILRCIKELKQQGFQLKAIKLLMPELENADTKEFEKILGLKEEMNRKVELEGSKQQGTSLTKQEDNEARELVVDDKMAQFQDIMHKIMINALQENNEIIGQAISQNVSNNVVKELDFQFRNREEQEEERFKKLDKTIRNMQKVRQEAAISLDQKTVKKKKRGFFRRNKKSI